VTPADVRASCGAEAIEVVLPDPWLLVDLTPGAGVDMIAGLARRFGAKTGDWTPDGRAEITDALTAVAAAGAVCLLVRPATGSGWAVPVVGCFRLLPCVAGTAEQVARAASDYPEASSAIGYLDGLPVVATVRRRVRTLEVRYVVLCPAVTVTVEFSAPLTVDVHRIVNEAARVISSIVVN
jgi:hypothetical protein